MKTGRPEKTPRPELGRTAQSEATLRRERQAAALRENLRRRKARERGLDDPPAKPGTKRPEVPG